MGRMGPERVTGNPTQKHPLSNNHDFIRLWTSGASSGLGTSMAALVYPLLALSVADTGRAVNLRSLPDQVREPAQEGRVVHTAPWSLP